MTTDLEIARAATLRPITEIAERAGIPLEALEPHGRYKAKIGMDFVRAQEGRPEGALVLVTGINPTAAGEGKTTTTIGLGDALNALGTRTMIALREPSLGPCFGVKGGATGGGRAQVAPMEEINLHFTGDFHAITSANNLLSAMIDNHVYWGNALDLDARRIAWKRAIDMNDRALRLAAVGLGGVANGFPREDGFDITVASEVMAIFCLSKDLDDLRARLGKIIIGQARDGRAVTAHELKADGAMAALLRDALMPNLVQTLEGSPALVHGGPFANIAHGCNSVIATRLGLRLADVVVTEAGFGADLGAEKFLDIKCRMAGLKPAACVVVATVRALKMHGGVAKAALGTEDVAAVRRGLSNLERHVENMGKFGLPVVVALNRFTSDTDAEIAAVQETMRAAGTRAILCTHWGDGAAGAAELARAVQDLIAGGTSRFQPIYPDDMPLADKIATIAREVYRASDIALPPALAMRLKKFEEAGFRNAPVCIAKTQYSFSANPALLGAPSGHTLPVREVRLSAGAGFVVAICGDVMTMPGLPRHPAAETIGLDAEGRIDGLF
ncbi:formate--tetrahydrofolate ligase [Roseomonas sp. SSH11]|uniref:Formate--tetrahydrofolate ligase n=1 Tax=Pararoseomonas baculiformis TaxID=2820812 RepID=A0ABS4AB98_9PROT|nr:formate--tetrahydrofolate ligase [Pararoseomonas baculiformis]MBP0444271.1 formate--tetrahydrofolate ligase [Pararoseomonas baculiformis]